MCTSRLVAALAAAAALACSQYDGGHKPAPYELILVPVTDYVTSSKTLAGDDGVAYTQQTDVMPAPTTGPVATVSSPMAVIPGGAAFFEVSSETAFDTIFVGAGGAYGFFQIPVTPATSQSVVVTIPQDAPTTIPLTFALGSQGVVGEAVMVMLRLLPVGTGAVQVSLTFDQPTDVDLYLVEPGGEEIYYSHRTSAAGGRLDLDANAACNVSSVFNENITYEDADPPRGTYTVRVNYWDECNLVPPTRFVVTTVVDGVVSTYLGTLNPPGVGGGAGAGAVVATFTY